MPQTPSKRLVSVGECMVELSGGIDGTFKMGFAGDTLNTAWYAKAALGPDWEVSYFTALGDDRYSSSMREFLEAGGITTDLIRTIPGKRPGLYIIHQEAGDRHFTYWRENSAARLLADDPEALLTAVNGADCLYFSGITLAILKPARRQDLLDVIDGAHERGTVIAFDPNIRPALWPDHNELRAALIDAASVSDIVLPTYGDEVPFFGDKSPEDTIARYLKAGAREVVVKNGADPVHLSTGHASLFISVEDVENIVDATGAGDSFNGAYLAARLTGHDLEPSARAGNRMAAKVIQHQGALLPRAR